MGRHPGDQVIDGSCDLPPDRSYRVFDQGVDTAADEFWLIDRRPACPVGRVVAVTQRGGLPLQQERAPPHDNARAVVQVQAHGDLWRSLDRGHRPYLLLWPLTLFQCLRVEARKSERAMLTEASAGHEQPHVRLGADEGTPALFRG